MQWRRDIGRSVAYVNSITSGDANVQSSRFRASIYYDIKTFHIVARASCTSPLKPFHTVYHTQYIFIHVSLWITFWQGFVPPCKEGVIAVESLPKTRFDSIWLQCSRTHNTLILSKISCNGKETLENYAVRIAIGLEPFTSPYNPLRIPPL